MATKLLTDASYVKRNKAQEAKDFKAGKRVNAGFADLTPPSAKVEAPVVTAPVLSAKDKAAAKKEALAEFKASEAKKLADEAGAGEDKTVEETK